MIEAPRIDDNAGWKFLRAFSGEEASMRAVIEQSESHGSFRFSIERYFGPADEDEGQWPTGFWQALSRSGLYGSATEAETEAERFLSRKS